MARLARATGPALSTAEVTAQRDRLMAALAAVLEESTDVYKKSASSCEYHRAIESHLHPRDTVISFNYDFSTAKASGQRSTGTDSKSQAVSTGTTVGMRPIRQPRPAIRSTC